MENETRKCQNCKADFVIEPEDFVFYENMHVPPPTFCWRCRLQRRLATRPGHTLFKVQCGVCKKDVVSTYPPDSPFPIYCSHCWHGDSWGALDYGRNYDFSKPFLEQYRDLLYSVPRQATKMRNSATCHYCEGVVDCDNCYMVNGGYKSQDCMYGDPILSRNAVDSSIVLNVDHTYETISTTNAYNTSFVYFSEDCIDSSFLYDCKNCSNCFGCINLRGQDHRIFNEKFSKEEYKERIKYWDLGSYQRLLEAKEKFAQLRKRIPRRFAIITNGIDVTGDDIQNTKDCKVCFITKGGVENCKYIWIAGLLLKDSYDTTSGGDTSQLIYDSISGVAGERVMFSEGFNVNTDCEYSSQPFGSSNIFGCVGVKHKKYCILNKQYTKEEYNALRKKIIEHMNEMPYIDAKGREYKYGEFPPIEISSYPYNLSWAMEKFPLTKEEARERGYPWFDRDQSQYKIDIVSAELPDHIRDVDDSITQKVIECAHKGECNQQCTTAFRIIPDELAFYKQINVALPRLCPNCRHYERLREFNPLQLRHAQCQCQSEASSYVNQSAHSHGSEPCTNEFETAIAPDRKEIVYCQQCYNEEFL